MEYSTETPFLALPPPTENSLAFNIVLLTITIPLIFLTIVGNALVIGAWICQKTIRTPSNAYLISLAVADLITGLFAFPPTVHYSYKREWVYGGAVCEVWLVMCFAMYSITAYHLLAVALDRYRIVTDGISYLQRRNLKSVGEKLVVIWGLGLWVTTPVILDWKHISKDPTGEKHCVSNKIPYWVVHYCCASFWFPALFLIRTYYKVYTNIRQRNEKIFGGEKPSFEDTEETTISNDKEDRVTRVDVRSTINGQESFTSSTRSPTHLVKERKSAVTLTIITCAFLVAWLPWNILCLVDVASATLKPTPNMYMSSAIFGLANSCINPIVYAARVPEFQKVLRRFIRK